MSKTLLVWILALVLPVMVWGARIDELQSQISDKNAMIQALEEEIARLQGDIEKTEKEAGSLQNQIKIISATISKLSKDISVTQRKIEAAELNLEKLGIEIGAKVVSIGELGGNLAELLRNLNELESQSLIEVMLAKSSISEFFQDLDHIEDLSARMRTQLLEFKEAKKNLEGQKTAEEKVRQELNDLGLELKARRAIEQSEKKEKDSLLSATKNRERNYQQLLSEREAQKEALETEIRSIEEELRVAIDPSSLPRTGSGVLSWPLDKVFITQYFGNTAFATQNPQIYNGGGHNGIDLRASIGTPVKASLAGVVQATGNTDLQRGCYSYGKWVLIGHSNGLSTLYAHLSYISVKAGDAVGLRQVIGFSGNTGYSTGPHLHLTVLATQGVRIVRLGDIRAKTKCANMEIPVASFNSYLNPLSYL